MKARHLGIAAISAEGAALCYRTLVQEAQAAMGEHAHPEISLHCFSMSEHMAAIEAGDWPQVGRLLLASAQKLVAGGAELLLCPDNTVHPGLALIRAQSPAPWLHIGEEVAKAAQARGFRRIGVLGTRFLMEGPVYPQALAALGMEAVIPDEAQRLGIHRRIFGELVQGRFEPETRRYFQAVIQTLADQGCDAVVLGCTEIPLLIGESDSPLPVLDSTRLLARAALRFAINPGISPEGP
ncbi:amino acid racemase [Gallaecimonas kandeliae]|uniref:aspartate/glutamate racemase family protein n=1 Tax=Gallaecimonas kandeliae TaxID=3029055 RepID=UPI0026473365|nr:amino acid racemase [Gallaecimonas kandeliae]WKE65392.1 amino acid racemase [Gallaecimonas kandeliae]